MTSGLDAIIAEANAAFYHAADKVKHMLGQALQLDAAHTKHITVAQEMAGALYYVFSNYTLKARRSTIPTPIGYDQPAPALPTAGPSAKARGKQKVVLEEKPEDCGCQLECGKYFHSCTISTTTAPKAIITSDDDLELDNAAPQPMLAPAKPLKGVLKRTRKIIPNPVSQKGASDLEIDELEEPMSAGPVSMNTACLANSLQEDIKEDSTSSVWSPACDGLEVQRFINDFSSQARYQITLASVSMAMDITILAIPGLGTSATAQTLCSCSLILGTGCIFVEMMVQHFGERIGSLDFAPKIDITHRTGILSMKEEEDACHDYKHTNFFLCTEVFYLYW
ncbi:hypothetical protein BDR04DRAFT_1121105 [Suillus decipiens]|nr:hypothetical protein BDR04DRAFT_1121105 [Suillus decipiens]